MTALPCRLSLPSKRFASVAIIRANKEHLIERMRASNLRARDYKVKLFVNEAYRRYQAAN
jgi:hypothetical protein